ncbi:MAG: hypothetical protein ACXVFN_07575 [Solirubrobacteraceae bacterium]
MSDAKPHRTLIVANRTAATPQLIDEVGRRAHQRPTEFALLIPNTEAAGDWTLSIALPILEKAAHGPVQGVVGGTDPFESVKDALAADSYDDMILATLHHKFAGILHRDLAHRVKQLGVPVMVIEPPEEHMQVPSTSEFAGPLT